MNKYDYEIERKLFNNEVKKSGTYPMDYDFGINKADYLIGMSVPPIMIARIADEIYEQWLSKI